MNRRSTRQIHIGPVAVGGGAPISVQSMTKTDTSDVAATLEQLTRLKAAGCDVARVAVPDEKAADALDSIVRDSPLPLVADIHFDHRLALKALGAGVAGLRLNPGNIGRRSNVEAVAKEAKARSVPIRIGVNVGSLGRKWRDRVEGAEMSLAEAMGESALEHVRILEDLDFGLIKISMKASDILPTVEAYRRLATRCDYPFHVGITEAGTPRSGLIKSAAGIGLLLAEGLCDTLRVSLTGPPEEEVRAGVKLLQFFGLRRAGAVLVSCPTCGRTEVDVVRVAEEVEKILEGEETPLRVAVMGCEVNGPGEAREADLGIAGGKGFWVLFEEGKIVRRVNDAELLEVFQQSLQNLKHRRRNSGK